MSDFSESVIRSEVKALFERKHNLQFSSFLNECNRQCDVKCGIELAFPAVLRSTIIDIWIARKLKREKANSK